MQHLPVGIGEYFSKLRQTLSKCIFQNLKFFLCSHLGELKAGLLVLHGARDTVQSSRGTTCETNEESYCPAIGSTYLRLHCFFFLFYKCEVLWQVHQLHFSYILIPLQARMYKSRIEIIEKLLGVLELDSDKHG